MATLQKKQTARKTTGKHLSFAAALSPLAPAPGRQKLQLKPRRGRPPGATSKARRKSSPLPRKSILKHTAPSSAGTHIASDLRPAGSPRRGVPADQTLPAITRLPSSSSDDVPLIAVPRRPLSVTVSVPMPPPPPPPTSTSTSTPTPTPVPAPGPLMPRYRPMHDVLDQPISVCTRFATWLESQRCVHGDALLGAIEREGSHFLALAKATVQFDHALRGGVPQNGVANAGSLAEHARTLRVFAELLRAKLAEGSLSTELESAVLRDGEPLLRLALCCLDFDRAISGDSS